jgi:calpain-15
MKADFSEGLLEPNVFYDTIEPNDIKMGVLGDEWFLSALSILAERPALVERLFITKETNAMGIYRVKLCKNGEWVTVTVDDYFPCFPEGEPLFARCHGNEMWTLILEKAYAKLHGNYYLLKGGYVNEALLDLTGCPTISYDLKDEYVKHFVENGQFWELLKYFDEESYLISLSIDGEGRWVDNIKSED